MTKKRDRISDEVKKTENLNNIEKYKTALKKVHFINELKGGLGAQLKENPRGVKIYKKSWFEKFLASLKKIFTKF